jgi:hypothetical protein
MTRIRLHFLLVLALLAPSLEARAWEVLAKGIRYLRKSTANQKIHAIRVNLRSPHVGFRATRRSHWGRVVSSFGKLYGATVAVNGDFFGSTGVSGLAVADGKLLSSDSQESYLALGADNKVEIQKSAHDQLPAKDVPRWYRQAVGGRPVLLWDGKVGSKVDCEGTLCTLRHPRTATGLSADRRYLFLVVVDGRRPGAAGMTTRELAEHMKGLGAHWALNHDGGGSSTMWIRGKGVVNRPSDGRERVVKNHLAVTWQTPYCHGTLRGQVSNAKNAKPIRGAQVSVDGGTWKATTNATGLYEVKRVQCGIRSIAAQARRFLPGKRSATVDPMSTAGANLKLAPQ